ncbi:MAG TPA: wax ester/triacylglycerol synthase domain-containing protein [Acidimicrobiales bacterium]|jgi:WS/DGAT/MGAT family acyltransferase|nr:wax ester/triacylglycerol synthase domain-containing protein [Acidimicrobiales bacterium]
MVKPLRFEHRMGQVDAVMWALEADPMLGATIVVVGVLERSPGAAALAEHMEGATRLLPRLRQRVVPGPLGMAPPLWETDPGFDLAYHLRTVALPGAKRSSERDVAPCRGRPGGATGGRGLAELMAFVEPLVTDGLDRARPPWQMILVEGLEGGRAGLVARLHHAFTDGVGAVRLAMTLFDLGPSSPLKRRQGPEARREAPPAPPDEQRASGVERAWDDLDYEVRATLAAAQRALPRLARGLRRAVATPEVHAREAVDLLRSLGRLGAPGGRPFSPVMTGRSLRTRLAVLTYPLDVVRAAGRAAGGTVNDAFLAGVTGGLRRYHDKHGAHPEELRLGMAVDLRGDGTDDVVGNLFAPLRLSVPLQMTDPARRVGALGDLVAVARSEPALGLLGAAAAVVNHLPPAATAAAARRVMHSTDVIASNVPGSPVPLWLAGAKIESLVAFGPRSGSGLNLTLLSHHASVAVGINMDPVATPDADTLTACMRAGFDEVLALA